MRSINICLLACLVFATQTVFADHTDDGDDWINISKKDLCPALHKEVFCTDDSIKFDEIAKEVKKLGEKDENPLSKDQTETGEDATKCGDPLRNAMCSKDSSALCLKDKVGKDDDSEEKRLCKELHETCPKISQGKKWGYYDSEKDEYIPDEERYLNYTNECVDYLKREFSDMTCEGVGADFDDDGGCPRPTKRMPAFYIEIYEAKSKAVKPVADVLDFLNSDIVDNVWDEDCLKTVRELPCMPIYCLDDDDTTVQIKNKRKDCSRAMECISKGTEKLKSLEGSFLADNIVDSLRDGIKDSCETVIEGFENLIEPSEVKGNGGTSTIPVSIHLISLLAFLCLKVVW